MSILITILALVFVFGLLVFTHELGHFLAAKALGVSVRTFAFGFPPRIWSKKIGETEYAINALPLGGYVSLLGEGEFEEDDTVWGEDNPRSLMSKHPWELILIFVAGVTMNFLLAIVLLYICYVAGFKPIAPGMADYPGIINSQRVAITRIEKGAPAEKQGIKTGDVILAVNGAKTYTGTDVIAEIQKATVKGSDTVRVKISRSGSTLEKQVTTYKSKSGSTEVMRIGVDLADQGTVRGRPISSIRAAVAEVFRFVWLTFVGITSLFTQIVSSFTISDQVTGPVGIVLATNYFAGHGFISLLQFAALLSISLAVFNILPIPALDGGHILFALVELVTGRKISQKIKNVTAITGFGLLILLMITVTVKDFFTFDIIDSISRIF